MSSPELETPRRSWLPRLAALALVLFLPGCGSVQPLYGSWSATAGGGVAEKLKTIAVDPISGRLGHYVGDDLIFALNGTGSQVAPQYHLIVTLHEASQTPLIDTVSGIATAATVVTSADYRLVPDAGPAPVLKGKVFVAASYDRTSQRFADVRAARDAEIRDAQTIADQIRTQVAADLATRT